MRLLALRENSPKLEPEARPSRLTQTHLRPIHCKLRIGSAHDPAEREADQAADQVLRMSDQVAIRPKCSCGGGCEECRRKGRDGGTRSGVGVAPASINEVLNRPGRPLDSDSRAFFEPRFGHDFGKVRVHTDAAAAKSARSVNALAYAVGSDVVFDSGRYAPNTLAGRRLLAHELAHVVQQDATTIRRVAPTPTPLPATVPSAGAGDFEITQVGTSTTSEIFFAKNSSTLDSDAHTQIATVKSVKPPSVKLFGFSSADETATVAQQRADKVKTALTTSPDPVAVSSAKGNATAQAGRSDFSEARKVEIVVGSAKAKTLDCKAKNPVTKKLVNPPTQPCPVMDPATWTAFNTAQPIAFDAAKRAADSVASTPSADDAKVIDQFFGNHDPGTVSTLKTNLANLRGHVDKLKTTTQCGGQCDAGLCDTGSVIAYNSDVDAASTMTLCVPKFKSLGSTNDQSRNLIHESAHGTSPLGGAPGTGTADVAYRHERMLFQLSTAEKLRNSDSYALYALFLREKQIKADPLATPTGIATPASDTLPGFSATEKPALQLALAKLEKRLSWASNWSGQAYGQVIAVRGGKKWTDSWAQPLMDEAAARFPLTPTSAKPTLTDQVRMAGIADRYQRMHESVQQGLTATRVASGVVKWGTAVPPLPLVANASFEVGPDFFLATPDDQISLLLEAVANAVKDVEPAFIPAYVSLAAWIHSQNP